MKSPAFYFLIFFALATASGCADESQKRLFIGTSSNLQYAMEELTHVFENTSGIKTQMLVNSSGNITSQIEQGLQVDVFVSADMQFPISLYSNGFGLEPPVMYARGEIVIIGHNDDTPTFDEMLDKDIHHIAIANPKTAPYGHKAKLALLNAGIWDSIQAKIVFGDNVSIAHHFVSAGAAEYGVIAKSLVIGSDDNGIAGWAEIADSLYNPIAQGILMIKHDGLNEISARSFVEFMTSDTAKAILTEFGYRTSFEE